MLWSIWGSCGIPGCGCGIPGIAPPFLRSFSLSLSSRLLATRSALAFSAMFPGSSLRASVGGQRLSGAIARAQTVRGLLLITPLKTLLFRASAVAAVGALQTHEASWCSFRPPQKAIGRACSVIRHALGRAMDRGSGRGRFCSQRGGGSMRRVSTCRTSKECLAASSVLPPPWKWPSTRRECTFPRPTPWGYHQPPGGGALPCRLHAPLLRSTAHHPRLPSVGHGNSAPPPDLFLARHPSQPLLR